MPNGEREWIRSRVEGLTDGASEVEPAYEESVDNSFDTWSALKLIVHSATINMYTKAISNHADDFFYIDALAGSGLSEYGEGGCFYGSPIIAAKHAAEPFTKMYFFESDKQKSELLEQRLENIFHNSSNDIIEPEDWVVWHGDANSLIDDATSDIWTYWSEGQMFNTLTFADNQAMDFLWDSMMEIGSLTGDFLVNYQGASAIGRNIKNKAAHEGKMEAFFGRNLWETGLSSREEYKQEYMRQVESLFDDKCHQVPVKVRSGRKSYEYDIIYATRDTERGSGYVGAVKYVKEFVENVDGGDVEEMIDVMHGSQSAVEGFLPDDKEIDSSLLNGSNATDQDQSGLSDFP